MARAALQLLTFSPFPLVTGSREKYARISCAQRRDNETAVVRCQTRSNRPSEIGRDAHTDNVCLLPRSRSPSYDATGDAKSEEVRTTPFVTTADMRRSFRAFEAAARRLSCETAEMGDDDTKCANTVPFSEIRQRHPSRSLATLARLL